MLWAFILKVSRSCFGQFIHWHFCPVLQIQIRIRFWIPWVRMFLGLLDWDPDPLVRGMDLHPDPGGQRIRVFLSSSQNSKKNLDSYTVLLLLMDFISLKNDVNVPAKSNNEKTFFKISFLLSLTKIGGSGSESVFISQRHGSADLDPDPHQSVMDLQHCFCHIWRCTFVRT